MKKNRGITLIALIITVILLLILVGVSVNVIIREICLVMHKRQ